MLLQLIDKDIQKRHHDLRTKPCLVHQMPGANRTTFPIGKVIGTDASLQLVTAGVGALCDMTMAWVFVPVLLAIDGYQVKHEIRLLQLLLAIPNCQEQI